MIYGKGYSVVAGTAAWIGRNIFYYRKAEIKEILKLIKENKKILDLGCNTGYLTRIIKNNIPSSKIYGADINYEAVEAARKKNKGIVFYHIKNKFYQRHKFDYVVASHILEHIKEPKKFIDNIKKILNPKGKLIIVVPQERIRGDLNIPHILYNFVRGRFENPHIRKINFELCKKMLSENKLIISKYKYINLFFPFVSNKKTFYSWSLIVMAELK